MEVLGYIFRTVAAVLYAYLFFLILRFFIDFFMRNASGLNKIKLFLYKLTNPFVKLFAKTPGNVSLTSVGLSIFVVALLAYASNSAGHMATSDIVFDSFITQLERLFSFIAIALLSVSILFLVRFVLLLKNPVLPYQASRVDSLFFKVSLAFSWMLPLSLRDNYKARLLLSSFIFFVFFFAAFVLDKFLQTLL
ncbi:MAG: YggT family protein [Spirochaetales bacterium]|nr:YggT family protein [Spirochaetales bacterium]